MSLRVLRLLFVIGAVVLGYVAYDEYTAGNNVQAQIASEMPIYQSVLSQINELNKAPVRKLLPAQEAIEDLVGRLIDDTDLMGSSVSLVIPSTGLKWEPVNHGVQKTSFALTTASEKSGAMAYMYILWQLLGRQPVKITGSEISVQDESVSFVVHLELVALDSGTGG